MYVVSAPVSTPNLIAITLFVPWARAFKTLAALLLVENDVASGGGGGSGVCAVDVMPVTDVRRLLLSHLPYIRRLRGQRIRDATRITNDK